MKKDELTFYRSSLTEQQKKQRAWLEKYNHAATTMERNGAAIGILEMNNDKTSTKCVALLNSEQQRQLRKLDAAAAKLGAPYPRIVRVTEPMP